MLHVTFTTCSPTSTGTPTGRAYIAGSASNRDCPTDWAERRISLDYRGFDGDVLFRGEGAPGLHIFRVQSVRVFDYGFAIPPYHLRSLHILHELVWLPLLVNERYG